MDVLFAKIVQEVQNYLTDKNYTRDTDAWIRLELLRQCEKLSCYSYENILHALHSKKSNLIELSAFEPRCVRRRSQSSPSGSIADERTVLVTGLPRDVRCEELIMFFNVFYPVQEIKILPDGNKFTGRIHVVFDAPQDATAFAKRSKFSTIVYPQDHPLTCRLLTENIDAHSIETNHRQTPAKVKSFSTRLASQPPQVPSNAKNLENKANTGKQCTERSPSMVVPLIPSSALAQTPSCLKSTACATEQILFCQNAPANRCKTLASTRTIPVLNKFAYDFYTPDRLLQQRHPCVVVSVLNPHCFTIQLAQDALAFDHFQRELNAFYNTTVDNDYRLTPKHIRKNLCVICSDAQSTGEAKVWNRAQVLDFDPADNTVNLFHVDLGTWEEYVPISRLRCITERFHRHQVFSIPCRLAHVLPINNEHDQSMWTAEATKQFLAVMDQLMPEIEFSAMDPNGCLQSNVFVTRCGQAVCVNDYLVHIQQARRATVAVSDGDIQRNIQLNAQRTREKRPFVHPVIALYNRLGEDLQRSMSTSDATSGSSSSSSSSSTVSQGSVKLVQMKTPDLQHEQTQQLPVIFVHYKKTILLPDFNLCCLLKTVSGNVDTAAIQAFASTTKYGRVHLTPDSDSNLFSELSALRDVDNCKSITLYTLNFTEQILKHHGFRAMTVFLALEHAKYAQLHPSDLAEWWATDSEPHASALGDTDRVNQVNDHSAPIALAHHPPINCTRLPFSNRLIQPV